jgi:hypothetical protein
MCLVEDLLLGQQDADMAVALAAVDLLDYLQS